MKIRMWVMAMLTMVTCCFAGFANAAFVSLTGAPTSGSMITLTQGDTLDLSLASQFFPNSTDNHFYPTYYFPFCSCNITVDGWGTSSGRQAYGDFFTKVSDTVVQSSLTASDSGGHFSSFASSTGNVSGGLSWLFDTAGIFNVQVSSNTQFLEEYSYRRCNNSAWGRRISFSGYTAWCDNSALQTGSTLNNYTVYSPALSFSVNVEAASQVSSNVPEPATLSLLGMALLGLRVGTRKRAVMRTPKQ